MMIVDSLGVFIDHASDAFRDSETLYQRVLKVDQTVNVKLNTCEY